MPEVQRLGIVVIGRNEGNRLKACLESVMDERGRIVYIDSQSTDGSVALARQLAVEVVELDLSSPLTAARGRNAGLKFLQKCLPNLEFVQFVDGDCELQNGWLQSAVRYLDQHPDVAVVWGRLRERFRNKNIYHRLADMEWDTPVGESEYCGGVAMFRADVLRSAVGFDETMAAGEEPELCLRIRRRGGQVMRVGNEMAFHDADMERFGEWWGRAVRGGRAYAESAWIHGLSPDRYRVREVASIVLWGMVLPVTAMCFAQMTSGLSLAIVGLYLVFWGRIRSGRLQRGDSPADASLFAAACIVTKFAQLVGIAQVAWKRARALECRNGPFSPRSP